VHQSNKRGGAEVNDSHPDITDAQLAQLSFLDSIVENIPAMVFVKDASDLRFVRFNRAGEELLGYSRDELIGKNDYDFFPAAEADAFTAHDREVLSSGLMVDIPEEPIVTRHQGTRMLHTKKIPLLGPDGRPQYLLGISEDITEVRGARELLTTAREAAERANRAKSEFLSRMSHELRTPLNVILGYTQLLLSDDVPPPVTAGVQQIHTAGRHLLELINEVLDISRIEAGRLSLSVEPVQVDLIVREVLALITPLATARSVRLSNAPAGGHYVEADRQRLRQVLINLVTNAAKYGAEGGEVLIEVTSVADERVRISISDTGPGISADQIALLFQPFERLGADEGEIEGTGLGLALSKGLTEAMGGRIGVSSEPGSGSTFWIELSASHELAVEADGDAHPPEGSSLSAATARSSMSRTTSPTCASSRR
jgi:PAS domain S-box-containing protein